MAEKFTLFWDGPFSQWARSEFVIDGITYNCAEQYMMAEKARLFGDTEVLAKIMAAKHPSRQKELGRKVKGFDADRWNAVAKDVVRRGSRAKYGQNPSLLTELLATKGTTLVEASPFDTIWGIGLGAEDPRCLDRSTWRGTNWLGEVLDEVRDEFLAVEPAT